MTTCGALSWVELVSKSLFGDVGMFCLIQVDEDVFEHNGRVGCFGEEDSHVPGLEKKTKGVKFFFVIFFFLGCAKLEIQP